MFLLQMSGAPGSGKSTLAAEISRKFNVIILDHDIIKTSLIHSGIEFNQAGKLSYNAIWALTEYYLKQGRNVIIDSPCFYTEGLENGISLAEKYGFEYKYVECRIENLTVLDKRLKNRHNLVSQINQVISDKTDEDVFRNWIDNMKRPEKTPFIVVDSSKPLTSYLDEVIDYLKDSR